MLVGRLQWSLLTIIYIVGLTNGWPAAHETLPIVAGGTDLEGHRIIRRPLATRQHPTSISTLR